MNTTDVLIIELEKLRLKYDEFDYAIKGGYVFIEWEVKDAWDNRDDWYKRFESDTPTESLTNAFNWLKQNKPELFTS